MHTNKSMESLSNPETLRPYDTYEPVMLSAATIAAAKPKESARMLALISLFENTQVYSVSRKPSRQHARQNVSTPPRRIYRQTCQVHNPAAVRPPAVPSQTVTTPSSEQVNVATTTSQAPAPPPAVHEQPDLELKQECAGIIEWLVVAAKVSVAKLITAVRTVDEVKLNTGIDLSIHNGAYATHYTSGSHWSWTRQQCARLSNSGAHQLLQVLTNFGREHVPAWRDVGIC